MYFVVYLCWLPLRIKLVNLEDGLPTVEQARFRLFQEIARARKDGTEALKVIHGYGSKGVGGAIRIAMQGALALAVRQGQLRAFIPGEEFRISDERTWELVKKHPELKQDRDLGRANKGITIVLI